MSTNCEKCGRPGEVFYYKGVEAVLCGDCLLNLEEVVDAKLQRKRAEEASSSDSQPL